jgi:hypothetical protein
MKIKTKKVTKPRHPEMDSHGDVLDINVFRPGSAIRIVVKRYKVYSTFRARVVTIATTFVK